jgi:hypothetical protein
MTSFRLIFIGLLFLCISKINAQKHPVFYAGFEGYRNTDFEDNSFGKFSVGSQIYQIKFFALEIGFDYGGGTLPERTVFGEDFTIQDPRKGLLRQRFKFSVFTLNPKLKFGEEDAYITFSPKYHIGRLMGEAAYLVYSGDNNRYIGVKESEEAKIKTSFWSFAIGFEGIQISPRYWFALSIHYTLVDANEVWDTMEFSTEDAFMQSASTPTIGLGLRFYYNPFASKND